MELWIGHVVVKVIIEAVREIRPLAVPLVKEFSF